jgi:N6-adenosine-specific RNA methylase IME4
MTAYTDYNTCYRRPGYHYRFNPPPDAHQRIAAALSTDGYFVSAGVIGGRAMARTVRSAAQQAIAVVSKSEKHKDTGKYRVILADPPWRYEVWSRDTGLGRSAESHYPTMPTPDITALPIGGFAAPDCCLFMWSTWPTIQDAFKPGQARGFEYKACAFLWAKTNRAAVDRWATVDDPANWFVGMGYWSRANTEPCLLFTRGRPRRKSADVRQLIVAPIREHSRKPDEVYERIERLPYLELFARRKRIGWDSWGNEVESDISLEAGAQW